MAIEKPMVPSDVEIEDNPSEEELTVEIVNPDSISYGNRGWWSCH
jgi:hypothetical protein